MLREVLMKSIRIGQDLHDRMKLVGDKFGHKVNAIGRKALFSWEKSGCTIDCDKKFSTQRGEGAVLKLDTHRSAEEVRSIIDWFIQPYETMKPHIPKLSKQAQRDIEKYNQAVMKYGQPNGVEL
jgi:hypothetical protein